MVKQSPKRASKFNLMDQRPSFFKIFDPDFNSEYLRIPPFFVKHKLKEVTSPAILRVPRGSSWCIDVTKLGSNVFLGNGWEKFVEDQTLKPFEFLLFKHDGEMNFSVLIFQPNGMQRGDMFVVDQEETSSSRKRNQQRPEKHTVRSANLHLEVPSALCPGRRPSEQDCATFKRKAKSFSSEKPFFWKVLKGYNVRSPYTLNIPKAFAETHQLTRKSKVTLKGSEGKAWKAVIRTCCSRVVFGSGWRIFVQANALNIGDVCVFELVGETELKVHTF